MIFDILSPIYIGKDPWYELLAQTKKYLYWESNISDIEIVNGDKLSKMSAVSERKIIWQDRLINSLFFFNKMIFCPVFQAFIPLNLAKL